MNVKNHRIIASLYRVGAFIADLFFYLSQRAVIQDSVNEICIFTGERKSEVEEKFYDVNLTSQAWAKADPKTPKEILQFYAETDAYIYADTRWNTANRAKFKSRYKLLRFCQTHNIRSILDYGAGVGEYCIFLVRKGYDVTYSDVYGKTWQFSEWRFKRRDLQVKMLRAEIDPLGKYDLIICTDVLEHVKNPPLTAQRLCASLNTKGYFCTTYAFKEFGGLHLEDNMKYANTFDSILEQMGLRYLTQDFFMFFQKRWI